MATLENYIAEATKSYESSRSALQNQINALDGQLQSTLDSINAQYAVQQQNLDNQRQTAASNASMQAAGSGGSFGGKANIANRNYYRDTFVPAVTQLQTNQANDIARARQSTENQRLSLGYQLAQLADQAYTSALSRYDAAQQLEEQQRQFNENLAWEKEKLAQQLAHQKASSSGSAANSSLATYLSQLLGQGNSSNALSYFKTSNNKVQPAYVTDSRGKAVYNFASGQGGTPSLQSILATDKATMEKLIKQRQGK